MSQNKQKRQKPFKMLKTAQKYENWPKQNQFLSPKLVPKCFKPPLESWETTNTAKRHKRWKMVKTLKTGKKCSKPFRSKVKLPKHEKIFAQNRTNMLQITEIVLRNDKYNQTTQRWN